MKVVNVGSLNIDHVYRVSHIAAPGETLASSSYARFAGGKGANQSVALARAGATVLHVGAVGLEGAWLRQGLADDGVDVRHVHTLKSPGGHAVIQVDDGGQNSIVIFGGANLMLTRGLIDAALQDAEPGDMLLLQNETNALGDLIAAGRHAGLRVVLNPAPMTPGIALLPLHDVDLLIVNEHEGAALAGSPPDADAILAGLDAKLPGTDVCLTLGAEGAILRRTGKPPCRCPSPDVQAVDTTAAGDTFIGYFLTGVFS